MEDELQKIEVLYKKELSELRNKYKIIKKNIRSKYKVKKPKIKRKTIPKKIKNLVWDNVIGKEKGIGNCYCCNDDIDSKHFEAGHIISVANGGKINVDNLKPICSCCNKSMGKQNLEDFKEEYMSKKIETDPYSHYFTAQNQQVKQEPIAYKIDFSKYSHGIGIKKSDGWF
jgi:5-methylcytosine-specific restriction endonuclease McrA